VWFLRKVSVPLFYLQFAWFSFFSTFAPFPPFFFFFSFLLMTRITIRGRVSRMSQPIMLLPMASVKTLSLLSWPQPMRSMLVNFVGTQIFNLFPAGVRKQYCIYNDVNLESPRWAKSDIIQRQPAYHMFISRTRYFIFIFIFILFFLLRRMDWNSYLCVQAHHFWRRDFDINSSTESHRLSWSY